MNCLRLAIAALLAVSLHAWGAPLSDPESDPFPIPYCLSEVVVNRFVGPSQVNLGQAATLEWSVSAPASCTGLTFKVAGQTVGRSGSLTVTPEADTTYSLQVIFLSMPMGLAQVRVNVVLPQTVNIRWNDQVALLTQALRTPGTTILVDNAVNMNLTNRAGLVVERDVRLLGGRTSRIPGPRFYTTSRPWALFYVVGDRAKISGLRIEGAEMGIGDGDENLSQGIRINSALDVEVDHCEISGWTNTAVAVTDPSDRINTLVNPDSVRIHDNFIHHNQFYAKFGYGVAMGEGAYALIERNVFDWNRHAIASNGQPNTG